jgi:hypothetical protein
MTELSPEEIDDLQRFKRQYFQLLPIQQFQWPASSLLKKSRVQAWVYSNLFDQKLLKYSPPERYQIQILKQIISRIESVIDDSDEDVGQVNSWTVDDHNIIQLHSQFVQLLASNPHLPHLCGVKPDLASIGGFG